MLLNVCGHDAVECSMKHEVVFQGKDIDQRDLLLL